MHSVCARYSVLQLLSVCPIHEVTDKFMPLPTIARKQAKQCTAKSKRSQKRCLNLAAYGQSVCRFHGARNRSSIKRGEQHPNYLHGKETMEAKADRSKKLSELRDLEKIMFDGGFCIGGRTRGRKP